MVLPPQLGWCSFIIPTLGRLWQEDRSEFEACLFCIVNSGQPGLHNKNLSQTKQSYKAVTREDDPGKAYLCTLRVWLIDRAPRGQKEPLQPDKGQVTRFTHWQWTQTDISLKEVYKAGQGNSSPSTGETKAGGWQVWGLSGVHGETLYQKQTDSGWRDGSVSGYECSLFFHMGTSSQVHIYTHKERNIQMTTKLMERCQTSSDLRQIQSRTRVRDCLTSLGILSFKTSGPGSGKMAQPLEYLLCKQEDWGSALPEPVWMSGWPICNSSLRCERQRIPEQAGMSD